MRLSLSVLLTFTVFVLHTDFIRAELQSVAILFRHGERTPEEVFPKYGDTKDYRELGLGQLTLAGSRQLYDKGVELRTRYKSLLPASGFFRSSNMRIVSSESKRCVASLSSFMAGFLPPPTSDKTLNIAWQSFPFYVDNEAQIVTLKPEVCPKYLLELIQKEADLKDSPLMREWLVQDKDIIKQFEIFLGSSLTTLKDITYASDLIRTNQHLDKSTPTWAISYYKDYLMKYMSRYIKVYHETDYMKKVRGGSLITQVLDNFIAVRDKNSTAKNILIYSAHDVNLITMGEILNVINQMPVLPAYGDTITFELHQIGTYEPEVQVYYMSETGKILLNVPLCGNHCSLSRFNSLMSKYIIRDYAEICKL